MNFDALPKANNAVSKITNAFSVKEKGCSCSTCGMASLAFVTYNVASTVEIVLGSIYIDQCPVRPMIPIYLIGNKINFDLVTLW